MNVFIHLTSHRFRFFRQIILQSVSFNKQSETQATEKASPRREAGFIPSCCQARQTVPYPAQGLIPAQQPRNLKGAAGGVCLT